MWETRPLTKESMKHCYRSTVVLCGLVLLSPLASAAERKPRQVRGRAPETVPALTDAGQNPEVRYASMLEAALPL